MQKAQLRADRRAARGTGHVGKREAGRRRVAARGWGGPEGCAPPHPPPRRTVPPPSRRLVLTRSVTAHARQIGFAPMLRTFCVLVNAAIGVSQASALLPDTSNAQAAA